MRSSEWMMSKMRIVRPRVMVMRSDDEKEVKDEKRKMKTRWRILRPRVMMMRTE